MPTVNYREVLIEKRGGKGELSKRGVECWKLSNTIKVVAGGVRDALMAVGERRSVEI
jgi:hypothetical protein